MKNSAFVQKIENSYQAVSALLFQELQKQEEAVVNLNGEESLFVRFNRAKIRQNTFIQQAALTLQLQNASKMSKAIWWLTGDVERDLKQARLHLGKLRQEMQTLPDDPHLAPLVNQGQSHNDKPSLRHDEEIVDAILDEVHGEDMAGLYAGGPVFVGNKNSKGQNHWFSSSNFFFDYSFYAEYKAVKGLFAGRAWDDDQFSHKIQSSRNQLSIMKRPEVKVAPGEYRVYLAPGAVNEILSLMNWGALSQKAYRTGICGFQKLIETEKKLSPKIQLRENFDLGWSPQFNSQGEVSETHLPLIENGVVKNLLTNKKTAQEYQLKSNAANDSESGRSLELHTGTLDEENILQSLDTGIYISNLHYLNWSDLMMARITGMTRYACFWVEKGEIRGPIQDLRFDETLYRALGSELVDLTSFSELEPGVSTYGERELGGKKTPGLLINKWNFTL